MCAYASNVIRASECRICSFVTVRFAPTSINKLAWQCRNACMPARSILSLSRTGQRPYSTTLFAAYGRPLRLRKRKPSGFQRILAIERVSASGKEIRLACRFHDDGSIAIKFDFVHPLRIVGQLPDREGLHRFDERRLRNLGIVNRAPERQTLNATVASVQQLGDNRELVEEERHSFGIRFCSRTIPHSR